MLAWRPPPPASPTASSSGSHRHDARALPHDDVGRPLSPPESSRSVSPVLILPHSAAIPMATYGAPSPWSEEPPAHAHAHTHEAAYAHHQLSSAPHAMPSSPVARHASPTARSSPTLAPSSPRPSLKRLDTPTFVSPRSAGASDAALRVGAWVGMTAAFQPAHEAQAAGHAIS